MVEKVISAPEKSSCYNRTIEVKLKIIDYSKSHSVGETAKFFDCLQ